MRLWTIAGIEPTTYEDESTQAQNEYKNLSSQKIYINYLFLITSSRFSVLGSWNSELSIFWS